MQPASAAQAEQAFLAQHAKLQAFDAACANLARAHPALFNEYVLRDEESGKRIQLSGPHVQWHQLLDKHDRVLVWSSVESGKTWQISIGRVAYELGKNPNLRVLILSATDAQARKIATTIRSLIEQSVALRKVFPHLVPGGLWTDNSFTVKRSSLAKDPSVQAVGVHSKLIIGSRVDLLVLDDVLNLDNTSTPHLRQALIAWMNANALGRLTANARVWVVGTAFHKEDFLHHLAAKPEFNATRWPVVLRDAAGQLISQWSERWPMPRIEKRQAELGPLEFARQLLCEARDDGQARFRREWIDWAKAEGEGKRMAYQLAHVPSGYRVVTGVDLGVQQHAAADPTAMVTVCFHPGNAKREILAVESGRWTGPEILERLRKLVQRYQGTIAVENNAAQDFIRQFGQAAGIKTVPVTTGRNKLHPEFGVEGIAVEMSRREWVFPSIMGKSEAEVEALCGEMLWYDPREHTGDRLMAMWIACEGNRIAQSEVQTYAETGRLWLLPR